MYGVPGMSTGMCRVRRTANCEPETHPIGQDSDWVLKIAGHYSVNTEREQTSVFARPPPTLVLEEEEEYGSRDVVFTEAGPIKEKGKEKEEPKKRRKKGKKRKREVFFRTKERKKLLKRYHQLIRNRKNINKAIRDNRRHRGQLVFHRK